MGSGDDPGAPAPSASAPQEPVEEEQVETQDDAPVVAPKTETTKPKETKPKETKPTETKPKETTNNTVNSALDALNNNKPGGGSGDTKPGGNEGRPDGSISGKGIFSGGGGSGEWSLSGRTMEVKPKLDEKPQSEATIFVDIYVDRSGKVTRAEAVGHKGSTEGLAKLYELAEKAARSARFSADPDGPSVKKGTMTINFTLK